MYSRADVLPVHTAAADLRVRTPQQIWLWSIGAGALVFVIALLAHCLVYVVLLQQPGVRFVGALVGGVVSALLIYRLLSEQRRARVAAISRFKTIAEMNHHIRNALQTISYQRYNASDSAAERLKEAVDRIEWVLEEIVPDVQAHDPKR